LARGVTKVGHQLAIANSRGPETLKELAAAMAAKAVSVHEAARAADVVILSIPQKGRPRAASPTRALAEADRSRLAEYRREREEQVAARRQSILSATRGGSPGDGRTGCC
jgi:hypothetical protein